MYTFTLKCNGLLADWSSKAFSCGKFMMFILSGLLFVQHAKAQTPTATETVTVCGFEVKTELFVNSPSGKTTVKWTITNTSPRTNTNPNGFQDLSHWSQLICFDRGDVYSGGPAIQYTDPSQNCLTGNLLKFDRGTSGTNATVYTLVLFGIDYSLELVDAVFKSGENAYGEGQNCCVGRVYGIACEPNVCIVDAGEIGGGQTICEGGTAQLTNVTDGTGSGAITYQWQSSTTNCNEGFEDIENATGPTYEASGLTATTYFRRITINNNGECSAVSNCVEVTVQPYTEIPVIITPLCAGATTVTGTSEPGASILVYKQGTTDPIGTATADGSGNWSATVPALAANDIITATAQVSGECVSGSSQSVTVSPLPTVSITPPTRLVCAGDAATFSGPSGANLTYSWEFVSGSGTISPNTTSRVITVTASASYMLKLTVTNTQTGCSNSATVSFTPTVCNGCTPGFWKNHLNKWGCDYSSTQSFLTVFGVITNQRGVTDLSGGTLSLLEAISAEIKTSKNNGHYAALARHAVAAILNACAFDYVIDGVNLSAEQIIADVKAAFNNGSTSPTSTGLPGLTASQLAEKYRIANETLPCPDASLITSTTNRTSTMISASVTPTEMMVSKLAVSAAPNPFTDRIRFTLQAPNAGRATLEVYNMLGQKVGVPFEGTLNAGETRNVEYVAPVNTRSGLIYMLRMNGEQVSGKLMSTKQ